MCGGFWEDPGKSVSDTVSHVGQVISSSPIAQAAITVGGAMVGVPPMVTAGLLGANQASQTGDIVAGLQTGLLSYAGGRGVANYASTGSVFGQGGASGFFGGTGSSGAGSYIPGVNAGEAGYTLTGDAIADTSVLKEMGYSGTQLQGIINGAGGTSLWNSLANVGVKGLGQYLNSSAATNAAQNEANSRIQSAQSAADASKFRPVGVTSRFGSSNFQMDSNGNLVNAGYTLAPDIQNQQNILMGASNGLLNQAVNSQNATAPMGEAAQRAMTLGNQYLATDPQAQAQKYMADQQALLSGSRATDLANLRANLAATGRAGLMTGGDAGMMASNPEMNAYYNANRQQDLGLAAQATQGGMDYAKFGLGTVGSGGQILSSMYGTQNAAYAPYQTALSQAQGLEGLGMDTLSLGANLGGRTTQANQYGAGLMNNAGQQAAAINGAANSVSPWGGFLSGVASSPAGQQAIGAAGQAAGNWISGLWS